MPKRTKPFGNAKELEPVQHVIKVDRATRKADAVGLKEPRSRSSSMSSLPAGPASPRSAKSPKSPKTSRLANTSIVNTSIAENDFEQKTASTAAVVPPTLTRSKSGRRIFQWQEEGVYNPPVITRSKSGRQIFQWVEQE